MKQMFWLYLGLGSSSHCLWLDIGWHFLFHLILSYSFILIFLIKWFLFYLILLKRKSWYIFLVFVMKNNHLKWGYKPCPCFVCILSLLFHVIDIATFTTLIKCLFVYTFRYMICVYEHAHHYHYIFFFYQLWSFNDPFCVLHSYVRDRIDTKVNRRLPSLVRWIKIIWTIAVWRQNRKPLPFTMLRSCVKIFSQYISARWIASH